MNKSPSGYLRKPKISCSNHQLQPHRPCKGTYSAAKKIIKNIKISVSSTIKKPSKNYTCFISRRFGLFLIHLQSENKATLGNVSNSKQ